MASKQSLIPVERIERAILLIRRQKVMLDADLAVLYGIETRVLIQAVKRNLERFPKDFMFQLSREEFAFLRAQSVTSSDWGGRRYPPCLYRARGCYALQCPTESTCHPGEY